MALLQSFQESSQDSCVTEQILSQAGILIELIQAIENKHQTAANSSGLLEVNIAVIGPDMV